MSHVRHGEKVSLPLTSRESDSQVDSDVDEWKGKFLTLTQVDLARLI